MKQKITVRAIVKNGEKTLLLKRSEGRPSMLGRFELPGGSVDYGEQPEDALKRLLHKKAGIHIQTLQLYDAVSYVDRDDRDIQYLVLVYLVALAPGHHDISAGDGYNKYLWASLSKIQHSELTDLTSLLFGIYQQEAVVSESDRFSVLNDVNKVSKVDAIIYSDGGSRGNPGPSAAGFVIISPDQELIEQGGEYIGITNNSQAEYHGVRLGLERAIEIGLKRVDFRVDSMLVVNQLNGIYKVKNRELWPIYDRIKKLVGEFESVRFSHVKREFNRLADSMVNKVLDSRGSDKTEV